MNAIICGLARTKDGFVLLFTPDMTNTNTHYHVELTEDEAVQLSLS